MDLVGGMVLGPIKGHQQLSTEDAKVAQQVVLLKALKDLKINPIEVFRIEGIEQVSYLIVTRDVLNTKQGAGIILTLGTLKMVLVREERWRLHVKDAKSAQGGVFDAVLCVGPLFAMIGKLIDPSLYGSLECIEG